MAGLNKKSDWEEYQENYSGIQNIQAQRQQNLANAKTQNMAANEQTNMLEQASGVMLDAMRPAQLNSTTQGILGKYGVQQPQTTRSQSMQRVGGNTTIINNNNTTYNTVSSDYGGPVQGRALAFKQQEANISKFKLWLDNLFSRQRSESDRRDREYEKRERSLLKEQNKLGRKLEGIGASIGKALDPRRNGQQNQLKTLLTMLGIGTLAKNFDKVLDGVEKIGGFFRYLGRGEDGKFSIKGSEFEKDVVKDLGGNSGESIAYALKELLVGDDGLFGRIRDGVDLLLRERAEAIKSIKKPGKISLLNLGEAFSYVGDVLATAIGGAKYAKRVASSEILSNVSEAEGLDLYSNRNQRNGRLRSGYAYTKDKDGKQRSIKDTEIGDLNAYYNNYLSSSDVDNKGNLVNNTSASYIQGKSINTLMNETESSQIHTVDVLSGFQRLKQSATQEGSVFVGDDFMDSLVSLGIGENKESVLNTLGNPEPRKYNYVVRKKTKEENLGREATWALTREVAHSRQLNFNLGKDRKVGIGTLEDIWEDASTLDNTIEMIPEGSKLSEGEQLVLDKNGQPLTTAGYELTPKMIKNLENSIEKGFQFDNTNAASIEKMEQLLTEIKKKNLEKRYTGEKLRGFVNTMHSDTESENFSEILGKAQSFDKYDRMREELRHKEDRWYASTFSTDTRINDSTQAALGEEASPELIQYISKAQRGAVKHKKQSGKRCGAAIRQALDAAGMTGFDPNGMHGYVYKSWLPEHGYAMVEHWNQASQDINDNLRSIAKPGDIVVIGPKGKHTYGHVAMCTTEGWMSDFAQQTPLGVASPREYGDVTLFRPTNKVLDFVDNSNLWTKAKELASNVKESFSRSGTEPITEKEEQVSEGTVDVSENKNSNSSGFSYNSSQGRFETSGGSLYSYSDGSFVPSSSAFSSDYYPLSSESHKEFENRTEMLMSEINAKLNEISQYTKATALVGSVTADNTAATKDGVATVAQIEATKKNESPKPTAPYKDYTGGQFNLESPI